MTPAVPGEELVRQGLEDLERSIESDASLLVSIGAPRLRRLGFDVRTTFADPEHRLYLRLARENVRTAHSRYNAFLHRLVSFERAWPCAR